MSVGNGDLIMFVRITISPWLIDRIDQSTKDDPDCMVGIDHINSLIDVVINAH